jgi:hypothetical protein
VKQLRVILTVVLFATCGATAEITASLEVSTQQDASDKAYRRAELTITNSAAVVVESVLLKPTGVGLTVRYNLTVPPGSTGKQTVALPAVSPVQEYALTALDASGKTIDKISVPITWPAELVSTDAFIDDAFGAWTDETVHLPAKTRRNYLLVLAMFVTAAAATLFIRRPLLRAGAVVVLVGATAALVLFAYLPRGPKDVPTHRYELFMYDGVGGIEQDSFAVLSALRTTQWSGSTSSVPHPVWFDRKDAANDDAVVDPVARTIYLTLRPDQVRIIRPAWQVGPEASSIPLQGNIRRTDDGFTIEANFISEGSLLIRGGSVWVIGPVSEGAKVSVRNGQAQSYGAFMSSEGEKLLDHNTRRLLDYWRKKHRKAKEFYLIESRSYDDGVRTEVLLLPLR